MSWRDNLRPGSFRGVPFHTEAADQQGGRRQVVHEFPQRDDLYVEDLGLRPHEFRIEAFVFGPDYMAARDALLAAVDAPGTGVLEHHYRGSLTVSCLDWSVSESTDEGGVARFRLTFIKSGVPARPSTSADTGAGVESAAAAASAEAVEGFGEGFSVAGLPGFVTDDAAARMNGLADRVEAGFSRLRGVRDAVSSASRRLQDIRSNVLTLVRSAPDLAGAVFGLVTSVRLLAATPRTAVTELLGLVGWRSGDRAPARTPARRAEAANADALERLVTLTAAAELGRVVRVVPFDSYDDAVALRGTVAETLDVAATALADAGDDDGYQALTAVRLAIVRDVTDRGGSLARVYEYTPAATEPALVTAHRLYGDAGRADEIVTRNRIRHAGFLPGGDPLEVLTDG